MNASGTIRESFMNHSRTIPSRVRGGGGVGVRGGLRVSIQDQVDNLTVDGRAARDWTWL